MARDMSAMIAQERAKKTRRQARVNLEDLATRCLSAAVMALIRDASFDESFDWRRAGAVAVDMAAAIRSRASTILQDTTEEELALLAEDVVGGSARAN